MTDAARMRELQAMMTELVPYWKTLGFELVEVELGRAVFEGVVTHALTQNKILHGGVLASIADSACAVAAASHVYPKSYVTTINLQVAYLRPVSEGKFRAEGKCIRAGKSILFCEAQVWNARGDLTGTATSQLMSVAIVGPR